MNGNSLFNKFNDWSLWRYIIKSPTPSLCVTDVIKIYRITEKEMNL